jgi:hypothetical protein
LLSRRVSYQRLFVGSIKNSFFTDQVLIFFGNMKRKNIITPMNKSAYNILAGCGNIDLGEKIVISEASVIYIAVKACHTLGDIYHSAQTGKSAVFVYIKNI